MTERRGESRAISRQPGGGGVMRAAAFGTRRIVQVCAVGAAALVLCPMTAGARPASAGAAAAGGTVLGGTTAQEYPIVLETNKGARKVMKATIAIHLTCTSNGGFTVWDRYARLTVSKSRKFHASFGPETNSNDDGTTYDLEGSMSGSFNK